MKMEMPEELLRRMEFYERAYCPANRPAELVEKEDYYGKKKIRTILTVPLNGCEFTRTDHIAYLTKVGLYSFLHKQAIFFRDLSLSNFEEIYYYDIEDFQPEIEPECNISVYKCHTEGLEHLVDLFIDNHNKDPHKIKLMKKLHLRTCQFPSNTVDNINYKKPVPEEVTTAIKKEYGELIKIEDIIHNQRFLKVKWAKTTETALESDIDIIGKIDLFDICQFEDIFNFAKSKAFTEKYYWK